ncbi:MAG: hypothetical protein WBL95_13325 [Microcoleus sp.]
MTDPQASETLPVAQIQPAGASSIGPAPAVSQSQTPQQNLAFLIGDLLGAKTSISQNAETGNTEFNWERNNETQNNANDAVSQIDKLFEQD